MGLDVFERRFDEGALFVLHGEREHGFAVGPARRGDGERGGVELDGIARIATAGGAGAGNASGVVTLSPRLRRR